MICPICKKRFKIITPSHAKLHGLILNELKIKYNLKTVCDPRPSPFKGKTHSEETKQKCREKGNFYNVWLEKHGEKIANEKLEAMKSKISEAISGENNPCHKNGLAGENNPFFGKTHSKEFKEKQSKIMAEKLSSGEIKTPKNMYGKKGYYFSEKNQETFYYDSLLEKYRMIELDKDFFVEKWTKKHNIKIPYIYGNKICNFVPDFLINNDVLEEVKGYDKKGEFKKAAMKKYCNENNLQFSWKQQNEFKNYKSWLKTQKENLNESASQVEQASSVHTLLGISTRTLKQK